MDWGRGGIGRTLGWAIALGLVAGCGGGTAEARRDGPEAVVAAAQVQPRSGTALPSSRAGGDRVGRSAPEWGAVEWTDGESRTSADLRGQVVLVRFWTDTCPFCRATAPALAQLDQDYREKGVTVVGMFHPKPRGSSRTPTQVAEVATQWGWQFPVALDPEWNVLDA
ncbi:MAG: TlpA family protein disulfide reductase, partial [Deltaproteobacteria bacterium]|nr:TlpA family protein disulfide reductase [Deltaproteobacteria bacterium]